MTTPSRWLTCACLIVAAGVRAGAQAADPPAWATRIAVVPANGGDMLYVLDAARQVIRAAPMPATLPARIPLASFQPLDLKGKIQRPAAIAARLDRLLITDNGNGSLRSLNPESLELTTLFADGRLVEASAMAVSSAGEVAILDRSNHTTVWFQPNKVNAQPTSVPVAMITQPLGLAFDRRELLTYDPVRKFFAGLPRIDEAVPSAVGQATRFMDQPVEAFGVERGVYYATDGQQIYVNASGEQPLPVQCTVCPKGIAAMHVTPAWLFLEDASDRSIIARSRPVPIAVRFESNTDDSAAKREEAQRALGDIYAYLADIGMLPVRPYVADAPANRIADALGRTDTVIAGSAFDTAAGPFSRVLCTINPGLCGDGGFPWFRALGIGQSLTIPNFHVAVDSHLKMIADLNGTSVADRLRLDGMLTAASDTSRRVYLQRLNARTLEDQLEPLRYIVASPAREDLQPGTLLTVEAGAESVRGTLQSLCNLPPLTIVKAEPPARLPQRFPIVTIKDYLPWTTNPATGLVNRDHFEPGDQYEMTFHRMSVDRLTPAALAPIRGELARCVATATASTPQRLLLITEALAVEDAQYEFRRADKSPLFVPGRFYIAYRAVPFDAGLLRAGEPGVAALIDPAELKPGGPQDLLRRSSGTVSLPVASWSIDAVVPASDLDDPSSALRQIEKASNHGILLLAKEVLPVKAGSADGVPVSSRPIDAALRTKMLQARKDMLVAIHYEGIDVESSAPEPIAIGENLVDLNHPGLVTHKAEGPESALWEMTPTGFQRHPFVAPAAPLVPQTHGFDRDTDHGVHVAGLIAARSDALLPGLLPNSELYVIDTAGLTRDKLHEAIDSAAKLGVMIFNFSFTLEKLDANVLESMRSFLMNDFGSQLFIVAAGDDAINLKTTSLRPPVTWMRDLKSNMIGVGATTPDGSNFLPEYTDVKNQRVKVSNFGTEYLQLAAPGREIFSLVSGNGYSDASGSSQAVPQVAAAAAMLHAQNRFPSPSALKARLIYTSDSIQNAGQLWGGRLNVRRAVWKPDLNLYHLKQDVDGPFRTADFVDTNLIVTGHTMEPDGNERLAPREIPLRNVMRMTSVGDGLYRLYFLEDSKDGAQLRFVESAEVHGKLTPRRLPRVFDGKDFVAADTLPEVGPEIDVADVILDYIAKVPCLPGQKNQCALILF